MKAPNITNTVFDEANLRTYVIMAPRVLTDGELYRVIRRELLRRGGKALAQGETLTLTVTSTGSMIAAATELEGHVEEPIVTAPSTDVEEPVHLSFPPAPIG
jgi:hypothetical protein